MFAKEKFNCVAFISVGSAYLKLLAIPPHTMGNFKSIILYLCRLCLDFLLMFVAFMLSGTFLLVCGYIGTTTSTAVIFLTIAVGARGLALSGFGCNHLDIAPRYGGVLMGLTNAAATIPGIVGPYIAKAIAHEVNSGSGRVKSKQNCLTQ